jgi:hypothetical protein
LLAGGGSAQLGEGGGERVEGTTLVMALAHLVGRQHRPLAVARDSSDRPAARRVGTSVPPSAQSTTDAADRGSTVFRPPNPSSWGQV